MELQYIYRRIYFFFSIESKGFLEKNYAEVAN